MNIRKFSPGPMQTILKIRRFWWARTQTMLSIRRFCLPRERSDEYSKVSGCSGIDDRECSKVFVGRVSNLWSEALIPSVFVGSMRSAAMAAPSKPNVVDALGRVCCLADLSGRGVKDPSGLPVPRGQHMLSIRRFRFPRKSLFAESGQAPSRQPFSKQVSSQRQASNNRQASTRQARCNT
jgi:hypothetical protein